MYVLRVGGWCQNKDQFANHVNKSYEGRVDY
jgi:hypothetical protein